MNWKKIKKIIDKDLILTTILTVLGAVSLSWLISTLLDLWLR